MPHVNIIMNPMLHGQFKKKPCRRVGFQVLHPYRFGVGQCVREREQSVSHSRKRVDIWISFHHFATSLSGVCYSFVLGFYLERNCYRMVIVHGADGSRGFQELEVSYI